ncbi:site-specific integrase [Mycobacterium intracellulare]|uniref:Site-specific integrase n=2 Tax=Mycobacterium intracellulare TaxID=1767 RepID=A0AAE4RHA1_MYCIT|nr:site-specific integrase [Mycobacterium intracellulare]MDV6979048.1 site-specific integrase [Mycobacterium intracellulare]MDV6984354.1 site-specific integrase [Mycobacterium intracellulare]MDV7014064.1 site-specific integrase [Mycobacterium intracellulare]MDV7029073.1 site-specific integrase [Mycobacterium intracellulare]
MVSVRPSEVQGWAADIARKQSAATARHSLGVLRRVFEYAVRDGAIHRNPAAGIRLPKVHGNDPRPLTHEQLWRLANRLGTPRDRLLVLVAGYCGLRWGELAALRWSDIDFGSNTLRVLRAYSEEAARGEMSPVKDHQARTVPIPAIVAEELVELAIDQKLEGLVFPSANGTPLRNRNFRRDVFDEGVNALDLDITPHNLRDTAASLAIQAGASVVAVARLLGHESAATTLNHYAGLFPSDLDDVAARLDSAARMSSGASRQAGGEQEQQGNAVEVVAVERRPNGEMSHSVRLVLSPRQWREFKKMLDREAKANARLAELFAEESLFVGEPAAIAEETRLSGAKPPPTVRRPERSGRK